MRAAITALLVVLGATAGRADTRWLWLCNLHTHEQLHARPFAEFGLLDPLEGARINRFFRSWRTDDRRPITPRLLRVLVRVQRHFGGRALELVSGYRVPEDPAHLTSYHQVGHAADIRIAGVADRDLYDYCRTLDRVGCGLYPLGHHVHVDVRATATTWVDLSRYGEPARYVTRPVDWVRGHPMAGREMSGE